MPKAVKKCS